MTIIYKKVGRRYVAIGSFDPEQTYYPHGSHLVVCKKNSTITVHDVAPEWAAVEAALVLMAEAMTQAMTKATMLTPEKRGLSALEKAGVAAYVAVVGKTISLRYETVSMSEIVQAGVSLVREKCRTELERAS